MMCPIQSDGKTKFKKFANVNNKFLNKTTNEYASTKTFSKRSNKNRCCAADSNDIFNSYTKAEKRQLQSPSRKVLTDVTKLQSCLRTPSEASNVAVRTKPSKKCVSPHRCSLTPTAMSDKQTTMKNHKLLKDLLPHKTHQIKETGNQTSHGLKRGFNMFSQTKNDKYYKTLQEQFGFDPLDKIDQLKELKNIFCAPPPKVQRSSQYVEMKEQDDVYWHKVDTTDDVEFFFENAEKNGLPLLERISKTKQNLHISDKPKVKVIAEKYSKFKKNGIEIRKLDEKIACLEYEIYDNSDMTKPIQTMRAYFSLKPKYSVDGYDESSPSKELIGVLREKCHIPDEELRSLNQKQIELIDGHLATNQTYLEDLRKVLRRRVDIATKSNLQTIDLKMLYEIAKKEKPILDKQVSDALLSKDQLEEAKKYILKCETSEEDVTKRKVNVGLNNNSAPLSHLVSMTIIDELYKKSLLV